MKNAIAFVFVCVAACYFPVSSQANVLAGGAAQVSDVAASVIPTQYGPGSGTGTGRNYGPGSGTGMGRCRSVRVRVCRGGYRDGRGPRCYFTRQMRC